MRLLVLAMQRPSSEIWIRICIRLKSHESIHEH